MMISNLPVELQNKIFYYCAEHPCAKIMKIYYRGDFRDFEEFNHMGFARAIKLRKSFRCGDCKRCKKRGRKLYEYETDSFGVKEILLCKSCVISVTTDYCNLHKVGNLKQYFFIIFFTMNCIIKFCFIQKWFKEIFI